VKGVVKKVSYPYIEFNSKIASGSPIIKGTRITVRTIAGYYQMGMNVDEILTSLSHLTQLQQIRHKKGGKWGKNQACKSRNPLI